MNSPTMVLRRHKGILQILVLVVLLAGAVRYFYLDHQGLSAKLKAANVRHHEILAERNSLNRQLEVLRQKKADVEYALKAKENEFDRFKKDSAAAQQKLENDANTFKSNSLTRYKALDSEYQMLKSEKEDVEVQHNQIKKSFDRLKDDHVQIQNIHKTNIADLKEKHESVIISLQGQIEHYQKQVRSLQKTVNSLTANKKEKDVSQNKPQVSDRAGDREMQDTERKEKQNVGLVSERLPRKKSRLLHRGDINAQDTESKENVFPRQQSDINKDIDVIQAKKENALNTEDVLSKGVEEGINKAIVKRDDVSQSKAKELGELNEEDYQNYKAKDVGQGLEQDVDVKIQQINKQIGKQSDENGGNMEKREENDFNRPNLNQNLNNDQKFADNVEDNAQEGEENEENAAEGELKSDNLNEHQILDAKLDA